MSKRQQRAEENQDIRMLDIQRGEEDDPGYAELREITLCPACRGRCVDKHGEVCETCFGEGEI